MPLVRWQFRGLAPEDRTGFLFEEVTDAHGTVYAGSVAVAIVGGSRDIYALGMRADPSEISRTWVQALDHPINPVLVSEGLGSCVVLPIGGGFLLLHLTSQ